MEIRQVLSSLCAAVGPSGFEEKVARLAVDWMSPLVDEAYVDRFGNAIGVRRCGKTGAKRLLLDAHLDEIGLMVTGIEEGYLQFRTIGGVDARMLPDQELTVLTDPPRFGVVACQPPHVQQPGEAGKTVSISELRVDVGLSQEEAEHTIPLGTPMVFRGGCFPLGEGQICGKSMDDRACFTALLRAAELLQGRELDVDLYLMGSTKEEVSGAGAMVGTFALEPDCCVAVDVTHGKTPDSPSSLELELGKGPAIGVGPNMTRWMTQRMIDKAESGQFPYQLEVMTGHTGTNGWHMQIAREGIATSVISLPLKYMHTPIEVVEERDIEAVASLLAGFVQDLDREVLACGRQ